VRCQLIKGTIRDTYHVVSDQRAAILSIYRVNQRTLPEINAEMELLAYARSHGIIVPVAVPQSSGESLLTLQAPEGKRQAVLFTFIDGQQLSRTPDPQKARDLGQRLARLHQILDTVRHHVARPLLEEHSLLTYPILAFETAVQRLQDVAYLHHVARSLEPVWQQIPKQPPYYGLIHGDVSASNTLITGDGQLALLDFDFSGWGWRVYDVATYLSDLAYFKADPASARAFLAGYQELRGLTEAERRAIPAFEAVRHIFSLGVPAIHVNEWGSTYLSDRFITSLLDHIRECMSRVPHSSP